MNRPTTAFASLALAVLLAAAGCRPAERPVALTMPVVMVDVRPNGLPAATTNSPTRRSSESPRRRTVRSVASTRNTAMSDCGSVPMSSA